MKGLKLWRRAPRRKAQNAARVVRRYPAILVLLFALAAGYYGYETQIARPAMAFEGVPKHQNWRDGLTTRIIRNEAFMVGYSEWLGNPLWVTYQIQPRPESFEHLPRPSRFQSDWRSTRCLLVVACIDHDDYTRSGYDRGHLAPNHVIATRYGVQAQHETFLMTNISPQRPDLNRRAWQRLEEIAANHFSQHYSPFWVVTGPIFSDSPEFMPGNKRIAIPDAFYKIFIRPAEDDGAPPQVLAFVMPQDVKGDEDLMMFLTEVRDIEAQTGLNFFHRLDDGVETYIETLIAPEDWRFTPAIATREPRF